MYYVIKIFGFLNFSVLFTVENEIIRSSWRQIYRLLKFQFWQKKFNKKFKTLPSITTFLHNFSSELSSQSGFKSHLFSRGWQDPSLQVNSCIPHFVRVKSCDLSCFILLSSQNLSLVIHLFLPTGRPSYNYRKKTKDLWKFHCYITKKLSNKHSVSPGYQLIGRVSYWSSQPTLPIRRCPWMITTGSSSK